MHTPWSAPTRVQCASKGHGRLTASPPCSACAGAAGHPVRTLLQGGATSTGGAGNLQALVSPPATETMLAPFELELTPSAEAQSDSSMLMQALNNPAQFGK